MADFVIIKARTKYTGKVSEKAIHFCDENNLQTSEPLDWEIFQTENRRRCLKSVICWRSICRKTVRRWKNWRRHMAT